MLKKNAQLFEGLFTASDLVVVSAAWVLSYYIRFSLEIVPIEKGVPFLSDYLKVLIFVWLIWAYVFRKFGLYKPMRGVNRLREVWLVIKANLFALLLFLAVTYLFREKSVPFSRLVFVIFLFLSTTFTVASRTFIRYFLRQMRSRGYNLRYAVIVGAGSLATKVARRIRAHPEFGISLLGCLTSDELGSQVTTRAAVPRFASAGSGNGAYRSHSYSSISGSLGVQPVYEEAPPQLQATADGTVTAIAPSRRPQVIPGKIVGGVKLIGTYSDLPVLIEQGGVDQVIVALPLADHDKLGSVIGMIGDAMVDVKIVPDFHEFVQLGSLIEEIDGLPVVSIASTPLSGWNRLLKRGFDLVVGTLLCIIAAPVVLIAALLVKLTSRGPAFYSQERIGLDGRKFLIYKLRTMYTNAEVAGARFAVKGDPRVTPIGRLLRQLSIDELPQLVNVIRGQMSLVGPRPERAVFINEFRRRIPRYMLRHKVQAGMTGWAQVNGWRGNTSIERRIEHDLYYIENWSLAFDIKILLLTLSQGFKNKNAY
jgi:exopolysaccharide biosynthesis polyprenyl glycosylphosphotransferase